MPFAKAQLCRHRKIDYDACCAETKVTDAFCLTGVVVQVCKDIEKTINATIQNTLNALEKDCDEVANKIAALVEEDK